MICFDVSLVLIFIVHTVAEGLQYALQVLDELLVHLSPFTAVVPSLPGFYHAGPTSEAIIPVI